MQIGKSLNSCLGYDQPADMTATDRITAVQQVIGQVAGHFSTGHKGGLRPASEVVDDWIE